MSNNLSQKPRTKVIYVSHADHPIDWLALWAISLGVCAIVLAATALFAAADKIGAALILIGTAALISVILRASAHGYL